MKVKFDSRQFGKILFITYCFLLIPLVAMLTKTFDSLNQLVMNPGFTTSEKIRGDFPKLIFVIGFIFAIGATAIMSLLFFIRRNKHSLDFDDNFEMDFTSDFKQQINQKEKTENKLPLSKSEAINTVLNTKNLDYSKLLSTICGELKAGLGILYLTKSDKDIEYLEFVQGYAIHKPQNNSNKILFGEGLTGQAAASKNSILIKEINDNSIKIYSGLGASNPTSLLITPIIKDNKVIGIFEIASFDNFTSETQIQLEKIAEIISEKM